MIIAIANQKGGVGKTTTAVTIADGLARLGKSVLLVDLDSQGNVSDSLGIDPGGDLNRALGNGLYLDEVAIVMPNRPLRVVRSDKSTAVLKNTLAGVDFREYALSNALDGYSSEYVILDCAPSIDILHTAALVAADYLLIPTRLDQFSVKGVVEVLRTLSAVNNHVPYSGCHCAGIIPTFFDRVSNETQEQLENLVRVFPQLVMPVIPVDVTCRKAHRAGVSLPEYAPNCRAMVGYKNNPGGYQAIIDRIIRGLE